MEIIKEEIVINKSAPAVTKRTEPVESGDESFPLMNPKTGKLYKTYFSPKDDTFVREYENGLILNDVTTRTIRPAPKTMITPQKSVKLHEIKHDLARERAIHGMAQSAKKKTGDLLVDAGQAVSEGVESIMNDVIKGKGAVQHRSRALNDVLEIADMTPAPRNPRQVTLEDGKGRKISTDLSTFIELFEQGDEPLDAEVIDID